MIKELLITITKLAIVCGVFLVLGYFLIKPIPIVFWSVSKNECVKIIKIENGKEVFYDCSIIPKKYKRIWVK